MLLATLSSFVRAVLDGAAAAGAAEERSGVAGEAEIAVTSLVDSTIGSNAQIDDAAVWWAAGQASIGADPLIEKMLERWRSPRHRSLWHAVTEWRLAKDESLRRRRLYSKALVSWLHSVVSAVWRSWRALDSMAAARGHSDRALMRRAFRGFAAQHDKAKNCFRKVATRPPFGAWRTVWRQRRTAKKVLAMMRQRTAVLLFRAWWRMILSILHMKAIIKRVHNRWGNARMTLAFQRWLEFWKAAMAEHAAQDTYYNATRLLGRWPRDWQAMP